MEAVPRSPRFAPFHRMDRRFYATFLALCWLGVVFGFFRATSGRIAGRADYPAPLIMVVHAFLFVGWMVLLTVQVAFVRTKRLRLHKRLGQIGYVLVPLMVYSGIAAELHSQRFYIQRHDTDLHFFILPLFYVFAFGLFGAAALAVAKHDPVSHKRLIILATTVIVGAAYARWWGEALVSWFGDEYWGTMINTFAGTNLLLFTAVAYDLVTRGRAQVAYLLGVPGLIAGELISSYIYHADWWMPIARQLIHIRLPLSA